MNYCHLFKFYKLFLGHRLGQFYLALILQEHLSKYSIILRNNGSFVKHKEMFCSRESIPTAMIFPMTDRCITRHVPPKSDLPLDSTISQCFSVTAQQNLGEQNGVIGYLRNALRRQRQSTRKFAWVFLWHFEAVAPFPVAFFSGGVPAELGFARARGHGIAPLRSISWFPTFFFIQMALGNIPYRADHKNEQSRCVKATQCYTIRMTAQVRNAVNRQLPAPL